MKKNNNIFITIGLILITMIFFTYKITITYDSSHYLWLTSLLTQYGDFSTWDVARSIVFPLFIRVSNMLFGYNTSGLLMGMYIFYITMLGTCYFIYKDTVKNEECLSKKMKWIFGILFCILIAINPIIFGYYHVVLTEFFAATFSVLGCYLSWKWMNIDFKENKIKYIKTTICRNSFISNTYFGSIIFYKKYKCKKLIAKIYNSFILCNYFVWKYETMEFCII